MEARDYQMAIRLKTMLAVVLVLHAQLHQAQQQCLEGVTLLQQIDGRAPWEGHLYYSLFSVSYACNRMEEASNWLLRMLQVAQDWQQVELLVRGQIYSVRLALAKGDLPLARQARQKLETLIEQDGFALHTPWISAVRVQVWLAEGNRVEASAWTARTTFSEGTWNLLRRCELLMLVRVLLAQQQNVLAAQTLERFRPYFERPAALQTEVEWCKSQMSRYCWRTLVDQAIAFPNVTSDGVRVRARGVSASQDAVLSRLRAVATKR